MFLKKLSERIDSATESIISKLPETADDSLVETRLSICNACPDLFTLTGNCKRCGCFVKLKTQLKNAACPVGKW